MLGVRDYPGSLLKASDETEEAFLDQVATARPRWPFEIAQLSLGEIVRMADAKFASSRKIQVRCKVRLRCAVRDARRREVGWAEGMGWCAFVPLAQCGKNEVLKRLRGAATRLDMVAQQSPVKRHPPV